MALSAPLGARGQSLFEAVDAARVPNDAGPTVASVGNPSVTVEFGAASHVATEGGPPATVTVRLSAAPGLELEIPIVVTPAAEVHPSDFEGVPPSLAFDADATERSFTVTALDDSVDEDAETLELAFGGLPAGVRLADGPEARPAATVTLADNDTKAGAPAVAALGVTSAPWRDGGYGPGDEIEVTVRFDKYVTVTGAPSLALTVGTATRKAVYRPERSGGEVAVFTYTVARGDFDADGVRVDANGLQLEGGAIQDDAEQDAVLAHVAVDDAAAGRVDGVAQRSAFFGDLHIHTAYSYDAYLLNGDRNTPGDAYRYAKGEPIGHPNGSAMQLSGPPLDFLAVTDHAEYLGVNAAGTRQACEPSWARLREACQAAIADAWQATIDDAELHNEPGTFTALIGYEYGTSWPHMIHRNIIFRSATVPTAPFGWWHSRDPEDLWDWLDARRADGSDALAIPHNSNQSGGGMFRRTTWTGEPIDEAYAAQRMRNEPLVEVVQNKGASEVHPLLAPNDEWADFQIRFVSTNQRALTGSYWRAALNTGLELERELGTNPYRLGVVAGSDSHVSAASFEEDNYFTNRATAPEQRTEVFRQEGSEWVSVAGHPKALNGTAGLTGIWAEENTRAALFDAMRRRETFGTSGPRTKVRMFGGFGLAQRLADAQDEVATGYAHGVPMGGVLRNASDRAPSFLVWALKDPESARLQRLQIVKGWLEEGVARARVIDVACSDGQVPDAESGRCPDNGAQVDLTDCSVSADKGANELKAVWADADFDAEQPSYYYVRALENPTCRWSTWDAVRLGVAPNPDLPTTHQERAWGSPIWFDSRPGDAALAALALSDVDIGPFSADTTAYEANVVSDVRETTVHAVSRDAAAALSVAPGDTDPDASGHQVALAVGRNEIMVTVTAGTATETYRITVTRAPPPPVATLSGGGGVVEGAPAVVVASLDRAPESDLALALSVSGTGNVLSGAPPTSLTVPAGATRATLELATDDDRVVEDDGTVTVTLAAGAGYEVGGVDSATVAVRDNDVARFEVTAHPATIEEGGAATLTVSIANGVTFAARRTVRLSVTGLDAGEYRLAPATLELEAGERSVTATFEALEDAASGSPDMVEILAEVDGATVATGSVTVVDAGPAPSVSGVLQVGNVLQAVAGDPSAPVHGHQWLRGAEPIAGATAAAYTPVDADVSATLSVRVNARGRWRTSAPTIPIWAAPANPPLAADEEELLATTMTLETYLSPLHVTGYSLLPDRAFGLVEDPAFALGERVLRMFAVNNVGLFSLVADARIEDAAGLTAYWNGYAIGPLEIWEGGGERYWIAPTTQPRREYNRYYAGKSDGVRVAVSLRRPLPRVTVAAVSETVAEGSAATFRVELDRPAWSAREVALSVSGTGAMLSPELPVSARVEADATSATVTVPTVDDAQVEGDGTVTLTLVSGTGYVLGETFSAAVDVTDDDVATFAVSAEPAEIDEGGAAALTVAIADGVTFAPVQSIALSATGSASAADYRLSPETLELAAGASSATATLTAVADPYAEPAETATVRATHDGAEVGTATVTIRASEAPPRATVSAVSAAVAEGAPAQFAIALDTPARTALSVSVAVSETGAVLADTPPAAVGFAVGDQTASLALATADDAVVEADGTLTVTLGAGGGYVLGTATAAAVTVTDNDTATFAFDAAADEIDEGGATMVTVTVEGGVTFAEEQSIALSVAGTATADDYDLSANPMTLAAGANSVSATLTAVDDAAHEASETVTLTATHDGSRVGSATVTIRASDIPSEDATLWSLELTGVDIGPFDPATLDYAADVAIGVETTTVRATPNDVGAQVLIADGQGSTVGTSRTVTLAEGGNEIAVTVTAADGTTTRTYRIAVTRAFLAAWGERVAERDIRLGSQPSGIWSDGETLWAITDWQTGQVSAYALSDGARLPERDIRLSDGNGFPAGLWSDGRTLWVADYNGGVTAYRLSDGSRLSEEDLDADVLAAAGNHQPTGLWSDGATLWVADYAAWKVFAYRLSDKARVPAKEFDLLDATGAPVNPFGLWSDGRTALASAYLKGRVLGYRLADGGLDPDRAVGVLAGSGNPMGVWSDGRILWVVDDWDGRAYAYSVRGLGSRLVGSVFPIRAVNRADRVPVAAAGGRAVSIPDAALRARVAAALGKPGDAVIGERELAALASLDARGAGVSDLTGLEYAAHLRALDLGGNAVVDLGPLAALASLEVLNLDGAAADLWPVLGLAGLRRLSLRDVGLEDAGKLRGLTALEALDLGGNPIADLAPLADLSRLEALRAGESTPAVVPIPRR